MIKRKQVDYKFSKRKLALLILSVVVGVESLFIVHLLYNRKSAPAFFPAEKSIQKEYKIAIVIDDWGYNKKNLRLLSEISNSLTLAILPNLRYSKEIAKIANSAGNEVIVHLPLEPHTDRKVRLEKNIIMTEMDEPTITAIFKQALDSVPNCVGISNHMGSKATEDKQTIKVLFNLLKQNKLYFLDSFVTPNSICKIQSQNIGVKFAKRDVFLDNEQNSSYIRSQFKLLIEKAKENGSAVGIAHDRTLTLKTLKNLFEETQNIEFVFLSELVN